MHNTKIPYATQTKEKQKNNAPKQYQAQKTNTKYINNAQTVYKTLKKYETHTLHKLCKNKTIYKTKIYTSFHVKRKM